MPNDIDTHVEHNKSKSLGLVSAAQPHPADAAVVGAAGVKDTKLSMHMHMQLRQKCNNMLTKQLMKQRLAGAAVGGQLTKEIVAVNILLSCQIIE